MQNKNYLYITIGILAVALTRLIPHPFNFSPLGALALFAGSKFDKKSLALAVPLLATFISDVILNNFFYKAMFPTFTLFYNGWYIVYFSYALIALAGYLFLKQDKWWKLIIGSIGASILFFIISNLSYWTSYNMYTKDFTGLMSCYTAAIPFFKSTLIGNLLWTLVLFGIYHLIAINRFKLKEVKA